MDPSGPTPFHSEALGVGHIFRHPGCFIMLGHSWFAVAVGVAISGDPDAVPAVRSANGTSGYAMPFTAIPDLAEILKDQGKPLRSKG